MIYNNLKTKIGRPCFASMKYVFSMKNCQFWICRKDNNRSLSKSNVKHLIKLSKSKTPKHEYTFWDLKFNILPIGRPKYNKPLL